MPSCFVPTCKNNRKKNQKTPGLTFHRFPKAVQKNWLKAIGRDEHTFIIYQCVCSEHFKIEDFENFGAQTKLKAGVIPSLKLRNVLEIEHISSESEQLEQNEIEIHVNKPSCSFGTPNDTPAYTLKKRIVSFSSSPSKSASQSLKKMKVAEHAALSNRLLDSRKKTVKKRPLHRIIQHVSSSSSAKSSVKRRIIKTFHNYSLEPTDAGKIRYLTSKLKIAKQTSRRRKKKIQSLKAIISDLKQKFELSCGAFTAIENSFSGMPSALFKRMITNQRIKGKVTREKFSPELRSFAMTLHFYSSKAYNYVRDTFEMALPAPGTISSWFSKLDCSPGYCSLSIQSLKIRADEYRKKHNRQLLCSLLLDEMALKKGIVADKHTQEIWGYVDVGSNIQINNDHDLASEALVLMIVAVNANFKIPIAYFFVNKISGQEKANIVLEALRQIKEVDCRILSVTCDGPSVNFKMMKELGCNVTDLNNIKNYFIHPTSGEKVYILFDVCHMLKLIRNNWSNSEVIIDPEGKKVEWKYIKSLNKIQNESGLYLANKLRNKHVSWKNYVMKVNVAAQTLSTSVADALQFLSEQLELAEFKDVAATIRFIRNFDSMFDILNSRNPFAKGMKTPLRQANSSYWFPRMQEIMEYIAQCKDINGIPLNRTLKKVPFIGFLISAKSVLCIYEEEVLHKNNLEYVLTYKFSQDHLELFFCSIRSRNGWISNPNCRQFMYTFRRLLLHHDIKNNTGNCVAQDCTNILTVTTNKSQLTITDIHKDRTSELEEKDFKDLESEIDLFLPVHLDEYQENVVMYIAGFVAKKIEKELKCIDCIESVTRSYDEDKSLQFLNFKNRGGLRIPSSSMCRICLRTEKSIQLILKLRGQMLPIKQNFIKTLLKDSYELLEHGNVFPQLHLGSCDFALEDNNHKKALIEKIIQIYGSIRINSISRKINETVAGTNIRQTLSKLIIFKHQ